LIAILLPSLAGAGKVAKTSMCASNLRSLSQVMNMYASEWDGAILGNGNTTARFLYNAGFTGPNPIYSNVNCPSVLGDFDWMSPSLKVMGIPFNEKQSLADRLERFNMEINFKLFKCPDSDLKGIVFNSDGMTMPAVVPLPSYATATLFQFNAFNGGVKFQTYTTDVQLPGGYSPKIALVGPASSKIYMADGAKFSKSTTQPDLNMVYNASDLATSWSDAGAYTKFTASWDRGMSPGNTSNGGTIDARLYAYRHGIASQFGSAGNYKMNAAFFDGHAEVISDKDSANPGLWSPSGTNMTVASASPWEDTAARYFTGSGSSFDSP
jgi:prepilin-type processing-associated H-X9-DG protein